MTLSSCPLRWHPRLPNKPSNTSSQQEPPHVVDPCWDPGPKTSWLRGCLPTYTSSPLWSWKMGTFCYASPICIRSVMRLAHPFPLALAWILPGPTPCQDSNPQEQSRLCLARCTACSCLHLVPVSCLSAASSDRAFSTLPKGPVAEVRGSHCLQKMFCLTL